jgi:hypothetical protein
VLRGFTADAVTNLRCLIEHTGLDKDDIVLCSWDSTAFAPGHYICIDRAQKTVILCIRGTFGVRYCGFLFRRSFVTIVVR